MNSRKPKRDTELGSAFSEAMTVASLVVVTALSAMPKLKTALQAFQTAQTLANQSYTSYPPPLVNSSMGALTKLHASPIVLP